MKQTEINLSEGIAQRDRGISRASGNNAAFVAGARNIAALLMVFSGSITADDLREHINGEYEHFGLPEPTHPNCWGAVFRHNRFEWTGEVRQSAQVSRRAGLQRVWRLAK